MSRIVDRLDAPHTRRTHLANVFLIVAISASALAFFYFFYYYGITHQRRFTSPLGPAIYFGLPVLMTAALSSVFLLRPARRIDVVLVMASLGVSVYALNLALWFDPLAPGTQADSRSPREVARALRIETKTIRVVPFVHPAGFFNAEPDGTISPEIRMDGEEVWPLSGISNATTVFCNESGQYSIYNSDEHGFNNPAGLWANRPIDLAVVGDSFVQGACLPPGQSFVDLIRNEYPATLNIGISGEGPLLELAELEEYLPAVKPRVTLWCFFAENDLVDLFREQKSPFLRNYLKDGFTQHLFDRQSDLDRALSDEMDARVRKLDSLPSKAPTFVMQNLTLGDLRKKLGLVYGDTFEDLQTLSDTRQQFDLFQRILERAKATTDSWGGLLYFVYLPGRGDIGSRATVDRNAVLDVVKRQGLTIIDLQNVFQSQADPFRLYQALPRHLFTRRRFGHYNERGNQVVAEVIVKHLLAERKIRSSGHNISALTDSNRDRGENRRP